MADPGQDQRPVLPRFQAGYRAVAGLKEALGYDPEENFHVDEEALAHARKVAERGLEAHKEWDEKFDAWRKANPDKAALYDRLKAGELPEGFDKALDDLEATFEVGKGVATRGASGSVLNAIAAVMPELWGGSADLGGSNKTDLKGAATFAPAECATKQWPNCNEFGRQLHFGVREFTMGCITNGILLAPTPVRSAAPSSCSPTTSVPPFVWPPHADPEPVHLVPRLRRRRRGWPDPPAG